MSSERDQPSEERPGRAETDSPVSAGSRVAHFHIVDRLGSGGMGEVWEAEDSKLKRRVALKLLPPELAANRDRLDRMQREAESLAALNHPNIVHIYSVEKEEGHWFFTMELVKGETLDQVIPDGGLPLGRFMGIATQIGAALAAAHEQGIAHRDLKPRNIMVTAEDRVKVLDFGLAKSLKPMEDDAAPEASTDVLTDEGRVLGTLPYMSPEQIELGEVDLRTDIFSFGAVLYRMATGSRPFTGKSKGAVALSIQSGLASKVTAIRPELPRRLDEIIATCLERDPASRYQSAGAVTTKLRELQQMIVAGIEPEASVIVLPFDDLSPQRDQEYLGDGLTEALIHQLSTVSGVRVAARTSSFFFKDRKRDVREIGSKVGVGYVVDGSIQKSGDTLRVTAGLVRVEDVSEVWSKRYDRPLDDVFAIQDEISLDIVEELRGKLLEPERLRLKSNFDDRREGRFSQNPQANDAYLMGRYHWNRRFAGTEALKHFMSAKEFFDQALELDPNLRLAHAGVADWYNILGWYAVQPPDQAFPMAEQHAKKALETSHLLGEAHASLGMVLTHFHWDWERAEEHFRLAVELEPEDANAQWWYAYLLMVSGRPQECLARMDHASTLQPFSLVITTSGGWMYFLAGQVERAKSNIKRALAMDESFWTANIFLAWCFEHDGEYDKALSLWEKAEQTLGVASLKLQRVHTLAKAGRTQEAQDRFDEVMSGEGYVAPCQQAVALLGLGRTEEALAALERGFEVRDCWLVTIRLDPRFRELHGDPRFETLADKIGLPRV